MLSDHLLLVGLLISHFVIDIISCCLNKKFKHSIVFIADQALHIALLWGAYILFDFNGAFAQYEFAIKVVFFVNPKYYHAPKLIRKA